MDENTFLFVTCVNKEGVYATCKKHMEQLLVPDGYKVELFPVYGAKSMAEGYNRALENKAKYKVYLHQDTFILNKKFLSDTLKLFHENSTLGMLGLVGCIGRPACGRWTKGRHVGKWIVTKKGRKRSLKYKEVLTPYEKVDLLDGFLMMTQYDVPWKEDVFDGFHMYDSSQCVEFTKRGYEIGIPRQPQFWAHHYMDHEVDYKEWEKYQKIFSLYYKGKY